MVITDFNLDFASKETSGRFLALLPTPRRSVNAVSLASLVELDIQRARARVRTHLSARRIAGGKG